MACCALTRTTTSTSVCTSILGIIPRSRAKAESSRNDGASPRLRRTHCRTHLALAKDTLEPRLVEPPSAGEVIALPRIGGLHHRYTRLAT